MVVVGTAYLIVVRSFVPTTCPADMEAGKTPFRLLLWV